MATALTLLASTPYLLRYRAASDGSPTLAERSRAQLIVDSVPGPLRKKLQATPVGLSWSQLGAEDPDIVIYPRYNATVIAVPDDIGASFGDAGSGDALLIFIGASLSAIISVEFRAQLPSYR